MSNRTNKRMNERQIAAIEFLALPKRGGLTYEQVAEEVGIARSTLQEWRKDDAFNHALKKRVIELSQERLPEVFDAAIAGILEDRNAALFRTYLQAHGLLTEKHEVDTGTSGGVDMDDMKARIASMRKGEDSTE